MGYRVDAGKIVPMEIECLLSLFIAAHVLTEMVGFHDYYVMAAKIAPVENVVILHIHEHYIGLQTLYLSS